jgi:hypothetical protein
MGSVLIASKIIQSETLLINSLLLKNNIPTATVKINDNPTYRKRKDNATNKEQTTRFVAEGLIIYCDSIRRAARLKRRYNGSVMAHICDLAMSYDANNNIELRHDVSTLRSVDIYTINPHNNMFKI